MRTARTVRVTDYSVRYSVRYRYACTVERQSYSSVVLVRVQAFGIVHLPVMSIVVQAYSYSATVQFSI